MGVILFWIAVWFVLALWVNNPLLLASPQAVLSTFGKMFITVPFWKVVLGSLIRIGAGFLLGYFAAVLLAGLAFRFRIVDELLGPMIRLIKAVPIAAFVVLLLIWWGSSMLAVAVSFLVVLPNIYINVLEGLRNADKKLLEMAKVFRMPIVNRFFYIYRPALKPFLESGLELSLGLSWKSGVAAEVIGTPSFSIGGELYLDKIYLNTAGVLAWTAVTILLSFFMEKAILWLTDKFFAWNPIRTKVQTEYRMWQENYVAGDLSGKMVLCNVRKAYGEKIILDQVSTTYEAGKIYYLTDASGSGKTTLLRILCGLEQADGGSIDKPSHYSIVFQEDRLCEDYNAVQNVAFVTGDAEKAQKSLRELLDEADLRKPCGQLSGGMKRRVALVRAMEAESDVVLLDEPFTGMDSEVRAMAQKYIKERQRGRTILIATHIVSHI